MEAGFIASLVLIFAIGIVVGMRVTKNNRRPDDPKGVLNVAYNESYGDYDLFLNLQVPVEDIVTQKCVIFHVNVIRPNSQK